MSAMVRLNNEGLNVPVKFEELKRLPVIPNTGIRLKKKGNTDIYQKQDFFALNEEDELLDDDSDEGNNTGLMSVNQTMEEDTTTVFDLVHRGR